MHKLDISEKGLKKAAEMEEGQDISAGPEITHPILTPAQKAIDSICYTCSVIDPKIENDVIGLVNRLEEEIRAEADTINSDIAKLLGEVELEGKTFNDLRKKITDKLRWSKEQVEILEAESSKAVYWLIKAYIAYGREGWEEGPTIDEVMSNICDFLANRELQPGFEDDLENVEEFLKKMKHVNCF